jgi:uncharacterized protein (DUF305 family)
MRLSLLVIALAGAASAQPAIQPGAPGEPSRTVAPGAVAARAPVTAADVAFVQGMIPHHAQALEMTALAPSRTTRADVLTMAGRIEVAQADEIAWMERWLRDHAPADDAHAGHGSHGDHAGHLMPGMLTPDEMAALAASTGEAFDRLFLVGMIRHHEGALTMVQELFAAPGAAQDPLVFRFATDIDADQRADIARMRAMLAAPTVRLGATPEPSPAPAPAGHSHH